jgi:uncharacterized protein YigA (DUF484 family)
MTDASFSAEDIAQFLRDNPDFFNEHADTFANMRVPHPHETRAISLGERQIMTLRSRAKDLEWRLAGLIHNAGSNEKISASLNAWCRRMLAEPDARKLPGHIVRSLSDLFDLPAIALRLWNLPGLGESEFTQDVTDSIKAYAQGLAKPYCGPLQDQEAAQWLGQPPASLAIVALHPDSDATPFGLLVLGSDDAEHFTADMATDFLEVINGLASASLLRLRAPATQTGTP